MSEVRPFRRLIAVVVLSSVFLASPALAKGAPGGLGPTRVPSTTNFIYLETRRQTPFAYDSSYVGLFQVQYNYAHPSMQWGFTIAKQWQIESGQTPVRFEYHVYARGKEVNNYRPHTELASYLFHSSIGARFQFKGDAPWTYHSLRAGDTVDIIARFAYTVPGANSLHDFWANYRVGVR